jgi:hypothetical protein
MSNDASPPQEKQKIAPDQLPLPALPAPIAHALAIATTEARVRLCDSLNKSWTSCFPTKLPMDSSGNLLIRVDPVVFFPPFIAYGEQYYEAYANALMQMQPRFSDFEAWVRFALKTFICDAVAPPRSIDEGHQRLSEWQLNMGSTWRLFDHPNHSDLFPMAQELIDVLEDVMEPFWERFHDALHKAISRRTLAILAEGLKKLPNSLSVNSQANAATRPEEESRSVGRDWQPKNWGEVEICFISDLRLQITVGAHTNSLNYGEFGLEDRRSRIPNLAWLTLRSLAESGGTLSREQNGPEGASLEKSIQAIRTKFRECFKIEGDPLPHIKRIGYQTQFKISCAPSYNS